MVLKNSEILGISITLRIKLYNQHIKYLGKDKQLSAKDRVDPRSAKLDSNQNELSHIRMRKN